MKKEEKKRLNISSNTIKKYVLTLREKNFLKSDLSTKDVWYFPLIDYIKSQIKESIEDDYDLRQLDELFRQINQESLGFKKKCLEFFYDFEKLGEFKDIINIIIQSDWLMRTSMNNNVLLIFSLFDSFRTWINEFAVLNNVIYDLHAVIWENIFDDVPILNYFIPNPSFDAIYRFYNLNIPDELKSFSQTQVYFNSEDEWDPLKNHKIKSLFIVSHLEKSLNFKNRNQENEFKDKFKLHIQKSIEGFFRD